MLTLNPDWSIVNEASSAHHTVDNHLFPLQLFLFISKAHIRFPIERLTRYGTHLCHATRGRTAEFTAGFEVDPNVDGIVGHVTEKRLL